MSDPNGTLVFSSYEQHPWKRVSPTGVILGTVPGTPVDPNAPGAFAMGRLDNSQLWITAETYFYTIGSDYLGLSGGIADDLFCGGTNGVLLYRITSSGAAVIPRFRARMDEINPATWLVTRSWFLSNTQFSSFATGFANIAVNPAATIAYTTRTQNYTTFAAEGFKKVHRHDLTLDVPMTDLVTSATHRVGGLLTLSNGDILVGWDDFCKRYQPDGTLIRTYTKGAGALQSALAIGVPSRNSFWVNASDGTSPSGVTVYEFEVDTGALLNTIQLPSIAFSWDGPYAVIIGADVQLIKGDTGDIDIDESYRAYVKSRCFALGGTPLRLGEVGQHPLLVAKQSDADLELSIIRDHAVETKVSSVDLNPDGTETRVIRKFEGSDLADIAELQVQLGDSVAVQNEWALDYFTLPTKREGDK